MRSQDPLYLSLLAVLKDPERAAALAGDKLLRRRFVSLQQFWPADQACRIALNRLQLFDAASEFLPPQGRSKADL
jgi:tRNA U34 5-methylaminomethyl-2-thiouridine-forming methyltransferase MnmC